MLEVLVKTFSRCHLFDSCWVQGESSSCSMQQMLRFGKSMGEHTTEPDPGASMPSCQKVPGLFWQQRLQLLQSFWWAETQYGKASKESGQLTWFWHDPHRLIGCMEGLNKTSIHLHLLLVCPCPGDTHDLKLDSPLCSWKAASCISATPLRSHFAVCLAVHLCQNNGVWEKFARNKKKKRKAITFKSEHGHQQNAQSYLGSWHIMYYFCASQGNIMVCLHDVACHGILDYQKIWKATVCYKLLCS